MVVEVFLGSHDDSAGVGFQSDDEPGRTAGQAQATPLADGEILYAVMGSQDVAGGVHNLAGLFVAALPEELAVVAGGDEADILAIGLVGVGEAGVVRHLTDLRLGIVAHGHEGAGELILAHTEENVGLVLVRVGAATQRPCAGTIGFDAGVMTSGDMRRVQHPRALSEETELDLVVAGDTRVGSAPVFVLPLEVVNHEGPELALDVEHIVGDAQGAAYGTSVLDVVDGAAAAIVLRQVGFVDVVQLHGDADYFVALLVQQEGSDGRIDAAAHGDDDAALWVGVDEGVHRRFI